MQHSTPYYLGIDGGGTRSRAKIFDEYGQCLGMAEAGAANVATACEQAKHSILEVSIQAIKNASISGLTQLNELHVAAGLAGANVTSAELELKAWQHPFASFSFASDLQTAVVGAHAGEEGALLIVGTGSCAASWHRNELVQYGGHGFILGDKGSGAWLGRQAVSHTLECLDGVVAPTAVSQRICEFLQFNTTNEFVECFHQAAPSRFGELSPVIMQLANDNEATALQIVRDGAGYLSGIARKALAHCEGKLALCGGVASAMLPFLANDVQKAIVPVAHSPEWGGIYLFYRDRCAV